MAVTPIAPATQELTEITLDLGTAQRPSETQSHVSDRVVRNSARPSATPTATVPAQQKMPRLFLSLLYTYFFLMGANYTVVLPTVSTYTHSLGGGYWTAGLIVAVFMGPSIIITPLMPRLLRSRYMPLFSFAVVCQFVGNVCYGLGQLADSVNLLIAGRFLAGLVAMGPMLYLFIDATSQCSHRQFRTATIARRNNCAFLGMGMGPCRRIIESGPADWIPACRQPHVSWMVLCRPVRDPPRDDCTCGGAQAPFCARVGLGARAAVWVWCRAAEATRHAKHCLVLPHGHGLLWRHLDVGDVRCHRDTNHLWLARRLE
mmetsp:Transcript_31936/g.102166  ORF Transcript_31936/g.102166 Transcript_31936/m.102166 type:complete len:316 (-) Transcript_31936:689-1636(-)